MTHWIDVVHWYLNVDAPLSAVSSGHNYNIKIWEAPDTVSTTLEFPNFTCAYLGTYVSRVDDGGLEFRGELGTLKIDRARLAFYRDATEYARGSLTPEPEIFVRSSGDGSVSHLQNWMDCIRSRKTPNANIRVAHHAARTAHIANAALRAGGPFGGTTARDASTWTLVTRKVGFRVSQNLEDGTTIFRREDVRTSGVRRSPTIRRASGGTPPLSPPATIRRTPSEYTM